MLPDAEKEGLPHVHADGSNGASSPRRKLIGEEAIQRLLLAVRGCPDRLACFEVGHHRQAAPLLPEDLIHPHPAQRLAWSSPAPALEAALVDPANGLAGHSPLGGHTAHGGVLAVPSHGGCEARSMRMLAFEEGDALRLHPTGRAVHAMHLHHQEDLPLAPGQITHTAWSPAVNAPTADSAASAGVEGVPRILSNPEGQGQALVVELVLEDFVADQTQDSKYDLLGHRFRGPLSRLPSGKEILHERRCATSTPRQERASTNSGQQRILSCRLLNRSGLAPAPV